MHIGGNNVYEEFIDKLKKRKEERQEDYDRLKGMIAGFRLTNFNQTEESLVLIVEYAMNSFKDHQDSIDALKEATIYSFQRLETLEKEMKQLRAAYGIKGVAHAEEAGGKTNEGAGQLNSGKKNAGGAIKIKNKTKNKPKNETKSKTKNKGKKTWKQQ
jgi:hypothetical protein